MADTDGDIQAAVDALMGQPDVSKAAGLHLSHSEGPSHPQNHPSEAASQSDSKQRRSSADTTKYSGISFPSSQPTPAEQSSGSPSAWGGHPSQAPPYLPNGNHAGPYPWSAQQQQQQQQQREVTGPPLSYAPWHKQAADTSPFAAAALQPPPPPPKHAPPAPPLPRPVELPATLEPHLQLDLGAFVPAGSAGLLSTKLGQLYMDPSSAGWGDFPPCATAIRACCVHACSVYCMTGSALADGPIKKHISVFLSLVYIEECKCWFCYRLGCCPVMCTLTRASSQKAF